MHGTSQYPRVRPQAVHKEEYTIVRQSDILAIVE